jgi:hypothetical protein
MKKLYVKTQAPFIEVTASSADKAIDIQIAFKKYTLTALQAKFASLAEMKEDELEAQIRSEILYIKNASLSLYDEETLELLETITVPDTRTATPLEDFWKDKAECLAVLLDIYLESSLWKASFYDAYNRSLTSDISFEEAQVKN